MSKQVQGGQGTPGRKQVTGGAAGRGPGRGVFGEIFSGLFPKTLRLRKSPGRQALYRRRKGGGHQDKRGRDK